MPFQFQFSWFTNLPFVAKALVLGAMIWLAVVAWPVVVAAIFGAVVLSTMQNKRVGIALVTSMAIPALLMEGLWANTLIAGALDVINPQQEQPVKESKVAQADFNQQVRGAASEKKEPKVKVLSAVNGDLLDVDIDGKPYRLRLAGVDAPDLNEGSVAAECFAVESHMFLNSLLENRNIEIVEDSYLGDEDEDGNLWRYVRMTDGTKVNELMLEAGLARDNSDEDYEQKDIYTELAASAKQNNKGLWATCGDDGKPKVTPVPTPEPTPTPSTTPTPKPTIVATPTAVPTVIPSN